MDSTRVSEAPDSGSIPDEATKKPKPLFTRQWFFYANIPLYTAYTTLLNFPNIVLLNPLTINHTASVIS